MSGVPYPAKARFVTKQGARVCLVVNSKARSEANQAAWAERTRAARENMAAMIAEAEQDLGRRLSRAEARDIRRRAWMGGAP